MATTKVTTNVIADDAVTTVKILDDNVTYAKMQDTSTNNRVLGAASAGTIAEVQVATDMIADNAVNYEKVDDEFTTVDALSAGATVAVDFDAAQVFTLTPNANTTFNITNPKIGVTKTLIVTGAGGSGIVILRLPTSQYSGTTSGSRTVTTDGSDTIIKFTGSGSYTHS